MKTSRHLYTFILVILISMASCRTSPQVPATVLTAETNKKISPIQVHFNAPLIVFPETTEASILGGIEKIILEDSLLFVQDRQTQKVVAFDTTGKYRFHIAPEGKGLGEYTTLQNIIINRENSELFLYASTPTKLLAYDFNGQFKYEIACDYWDGIALSGNKLVAIQHRDTAHYLCSYNIKDRQLHDPHPIDFPHLCQNSVYIAGFQIMNSEHLHFTRRNDPTIYRYTEDGPSALFEIDFGEKNMPKPLRTAKVSSEEYVDMQRKYVTSIVNVKEMQGIYTFSTFSDRYLIDTTERKVKNISRLRDTSLQIILLSMIPCEDNRNRMLAFEESAATLKMLADTYGNRMPTAFRDSINKLTEDSNPVLLFYPIKDSKKP